MMKLLDAAAIAQDPTAVKQFFQERNLLREHAPHCTEVGCDRTMTEVKRGRNDDTIWRCPLHKGHKLSIRTNSFFYNSNLSLGNLFLLMYLWSYSIAAHTAESMLGISNNTVRQWYQYCRDVCSNYFVTHPFQIGGPGIVVQVCSNY